MCFAPLFALCLAGCTDQPEDGALPVRLAAGGDDVVGAYEAGVLRLEERFAASFDMPLSIAIGSDKYELDAARSAVPQPLAIGDAVELVLSDVATLPLVVSEPTASLLDVGVELSSCQWQYSTVTSHGACDTCGEGQRITMEFRKRWTCSCAGCWERYGGATWCEAR